MFYARFRKKINMTLIDRLIEKFKNRFGYIFHKGVVPDEITKEKIESFLRKEIKELVKEAVGEEIEDWYDEKLPQSSEWLTNHVRNQFRREILDKVCGKEK